MFELRCLMALGSFYCCLNSLYYLSLLLNLIINPIFPCALLMLDMGAVCIQLTASTLMGLKLLEVATSTPNDTPNATRSAARALPFFLYAEGTAKSLNVVRSVLIIQGMTFTIAATMGIGLGYTFLACLLYKFNHDHLGNPVHHVNDPELAALPNAMGYAP